MARRRALGVCPEGGLPVTGGANRGGFWRLQRHLRVNQVLRQRCVSAVADRGTGLAGLGGGDTPRAAFVARAEDEAGVHGFASGKPGLAPPPGEGALRAGLGLRPP